MFWVGTHIQSWNSEAQGQNSGRYVQMSSAHPSVPLLPLRMPLRLHHILLAAVLKKWKPQKVPKPPLSQQALPSLSERWKPSAPGQPTTVPGEMLSSPCNAGASRGPWTTSRAVIQRRENGVKQGLQGMPKACGDAVWGGVTSRGRWERGIICCFAVVTVNALWCQLRALPPWWSEGH